MPLTLRDVSEIIKVLDSSSCEELVLEVDDIRLSIKRHGNDTRQSNQASGFTKAERQEAVICDTESRQPEPESGSSDTESAAPAREVADGQKLIRSPMVGTFYRRPSPEEKPFVEMGSRVNPGEPLCMIEVMKLFTTIKAETSGKVTEIAAEDGDLVEFNQALFLIEAE